MNAIASSARPRRTAVSLGRRLARQLLPPIIAEPLRRVVRTRQAGDAEWEYRPAGWPEHDPAIHGWDVESVVQAQVSRWPAFVRSLEGVAPIGLSNEAEGGTDLNYAVHNTVMSFGYVLARAARGLDRLSMLDWGGGIGHYAVYARALMPELPLEYHCRELPLLARAGRRVLPDATFHESDETALARRYDLVMASSSLQYVQDWRAMLARLTASADRYVYVTRQPFVSSGPSFVVVQRPYRHGYHTEYPGWFLNRDEFLAEAARLGLVLQRELLIDEKPDVPGAPVQADYRGFLFAVPGADSHPASGLTAVVGSNVSAAAGPPAR